MRGRIINPFVVVLAQLDTQASTQDRTLREPTVTYDPATGERRVNRGEREVRARCQIETGTYEGLAMAATGNIPYSNMTLVFHFEDLDAASLIGPNNRPTINVGDRLVRIETEDGEVQQAFDRSPVYITEATPSGFGFGGRVNLLVCRLGDRPQGARTGQST